MGKQAEHRTRLTISLSRDLDRKIRGEAETLDLDISTLVCSILSEHYDSNLTSEEAAAIHRQGPHFLKSLAGAILKRETGKKALKP
jgi:hypothetical protein